MLTEILLNPVIPKTNRIIDPMKTLPLFFKRNWKALCNLEVQKALPEFEVTSLGAGVKINTAGKRE